MKRKPRVHVLFIPRWRPATANQLMSSHWRVKHRLKSMDRSLVAVYARLANSPKADEKRRLDVEVIMGPHMRRCDTDAFFKSLFDACVLSQLLVSDHPKWLEIGTVVQRRPEDGEEWGTLLKFSELE